MTVIVLEVTVATIITRIGGSAISNAQLVVLIVYQSSAGDKCSNSGADGDDDIATGKNATCHSVVIVLEVIMVVTMAVIVVIVMIVMAMVVMVFMVVIAVIVMIVVLMVGMVIMVAVVRSWW